MSKNDFTITCSSSNGSGSNNNSLKYNFDFSPFKNGTYQVSFSFISGSNAIDPSMPAELTVNFGSTNTYFANQTTQANYSNSLGILYPQILSVQQGFLQARSNENPPIILRKPTVNNFTVSINSIVNNACSFTANTSTSTTLTVTAIASGTLQIGDEVVGTNISNGTYIVTQLSGSLGGVGSYGLSQTTTGTGTGIAMTTPGILYGQPWADNDNVNLNSYLLVMNFKWLSD